MSSISVRNNSVYHKGIYDAITTFKKDGKSFLTEFHDYEKCDDFLDLHFSHLDPALHNIFKPNNPEEKGLQGLYLTVDSLKRVICSHQNGWINDYVFTQMADLLNFYEEFETDTGLAGKVIPKILFGDGYSEQTDFNPHHHHTKKIMD